MVIGFRTATQSTHIYMLLSVPPRSSIAMTMEYPKGKSATRIHRELLHTKGMLFGRRFWVRGYCVSTVGPGVCPSIRLRLT